jgi:hypothetical protein
MNVNKYVVIHPFSVENGFDFFFLALAKKVSPNMLQIHQWGDNGFQCAHTVSTSSLLNSIDCVQVLLICLTQAVTIFDRPSWLAVQNSETHLNKMLVCSSVSEIASLEQNAV